MVFLHTVLIQNRPEAADRVFQQDLPVNPLSMITITLRGVITAADVSTPLSDLYACVPNLAVRYRGQDIIRGSLYDLAVLNAIVSHRAPWGQLIQDAAGETWTLSVPICFGRMPFSPQEAFPAVRRGDLVLEMTIDTASNNADLVELQVETDEILDETPDRYLKYTTGEHTFTGTTVDVVRLPIGNPLLGVLLAGQTTPVGNARTSTWEQLRIKVDNVEALIASANWDTLSAAFMCRVGNDATFLIDHAHRYDGAAAAFANTLAQMRLGATSSLNSYAYLDFDPLKDGSYQLETAGRADVVIQRDAGTANLGRFIPIELVAIGGAGA